MELTLTLSGGPTEMLRVVQALASQFPDGQPFADAQDPDASNVGDIIDAMMKDVSNGARAVLTQMATMAIGSNRNELGSIELRERLGALTPSQLAGRIWSISSWSGKRSDGFKPYSQRNDGTQVVYRMDEATARQILNAR